MVHAGHRADNCSCPVGTVEAASVGIAVLGGGAACVCEPGRFDVRRLAPEAAVVSAGSAGLVCAECLDGYVCPGARPVRCPPHSTTRGGMRKVSLQDCVCEPGYEADGSRGSVDNGKVCQECRAGRMCLGYGRGSVPCPEHYVCEAGRPVVPCPAGVACLLTDHAYPDKSRPARSVPETEHVRRSLCPRRWRGLGRGMHAVPGWFFLLYQHHPPPWCCMPSLAPPPPSPPLLFYRNML